MTRLSPFYTACLAAAMLVFMTACSSDIFSDVNSEELSLSPVVAFTISDSHLESRGFPVNDVKDLKDFRADAYLHRGTTSTSFFQNQQQYRVNGVYRCDQARLWPNEPGDKLAFVAVAPWSVGENLNISEDGNFTYTVPDNAVDQQDLMMATADNVDCSTDDNGQREPVPLNFRHLLTQVRFVFGANIANYWRSLTVHSVKVENVSATGTWNNAAGSWQNLDSPNHSVEIVASPGDNGPGTGIKPFSDVETPIWNDEYTMFLMPQTLPEGARVVVDMSYIPSEETSTATSIRERQTYYIYLDGKKLQPGHTVTVEINSNYTYDCRVVNPDGSDAELKPLSPNAASYTYNVLRSSGADGMKVELAPECRGMATLSSGSSSTQADSCFVSDSFTLHTTENTSSDDRFIRLILHAGHNNQSELGSHHVVLKQRGSSSYGTYTDTQYPDTLCSWGFNWPSPYIVKFHYDDLFGLFLDWTSLGDELPQWVTKVDSEIQLNYDELRNLVRQPNSSSDGLANGIAINNLCYFINPIVVIKYIADNFSFDLMTVNGSTIGELNDLYDMGYYNMGFGINPIMKAMSHNVIVDLGGAGYPKLYVQNIKVYLPAIEELETIARTAGNPLEVGRTYWSSTIDNNGQPLALRIDDQGSLTRVRPRPSEQAWVHPVKKLE